MTMKTSDRGLVALAIKEGIVPAPYLDSVGVWTFGIGHAATSGHPPDPRTMPRGMPADLDGAIRDAVALFPRTLAHYEAAVNRAVKVPLAQHEFDALVSFHYNTGGIARAALTRHLNAGDRAAAAAGFMGWLRPPEIRGRREAEQRLFRDGTYPEGRIPVYSASESGRVGRVIRSLTAAEFLAMLRPAPAPQRPAQAPQAPAAPTPAPQPPQTFWGRLWAFLFGGSR
jgi:lysozyme